MKNQLFLVASLGMFMVIGCSKADKAPADKASTTGTPEQPSAKAPVAAPERATAKVDLPTGTTAVSVDELSTLIDGKAVTVFDANGASLRSKVGVIPGAVLLEDYAHCESQLPEAKDGKLVFYCASESCSASHVAAQVAVEQGYTNVSILPPGIMGWAKAGKPLEKRAM